MRLLIADDHALFRDALVCYIERAEPEADVLVARDMNEVMEILTDDSDLSMILLDLGMPGMEDMNGLATLRETYPKLPVALLSGLAEKEDVEHALRLGAVAYFPKTMSGKSIVKAIKDIVTKRNETYVALDHNTDEIMPSHYHNLKRAHTNGKDNAMAAVTMYNAFVTDDSELKEDINLTPRERDVLEFLIQGAANKEIARSLDLQVVTIKLHVRSICKKLGAKNRTQAAMKAYELGLV